jgi:15-cis-phytoene synthase
MGRDARLTDPELELIAPFLSNDGRDAILALHELFGEIRRSVFSVSDESLARVKLSWWRDEIERMLNQQANHPATRQLASCADIDRLDTGELGDALEGLLMQMEARLYNDDDEMLLHCWRRDAALLVSAARLAGATSEVALHAARQYGLARGLARQVLHFETDRRAGRCWIPEPRLKALEIRPETLLKQSPEMATRIALLNPLADMAEARYQTANDIELSNQEREFLRPAILMATSSLYALTYMRKRKFSDRPMGYLRRLFFIWRTARREALHASQNRITP